MSDDIATNEDLTAMDSAANDARAIDLILEGLQSGPMTPLTADDWNALRNLVRERQCGIIDSPVHEASGASRIRDAIGE